MDISGFGLRGRLVASTTFPVGVDLTRFADDTDPLDLPTVVSAETGMGLNGDLVTWGSANAILVNLSFIPNSDEDRAMETLLEANRTARGRRPARDTITLTIIYPDGSQATASGGVILQGASAQSVASSGRLKTRQWNFAFEDIQRSR